MSSSTLFGFYAGLFVVAQGATPIVAPLGPHHGNSSIPQRGTEGGMGAGVQVHLVPGASLQFKQAIGEGSKWAGCCCKAAWVPHRVALGGGAAKGANSSSTLWVPLAVAAANMHPTLGHLPVRGDHSNEHLHN